MDYSPEQRTNDLIRGKLAQLELDHDVEIIFAVESGSRAWGFPSPDSDYDVRFVYRRKPEEYLRLLPVADTIGRSVKGAEYDLHGWDAAKALKLALGTNATLLEWLSSPTRYRWSEEADALALCTQRVAERKGLVYNYYNLTRQHWEQCGTEVEVPLKKYMYALRCALTLRHLRMYPGVPPMDVDRLMSGCRLDPKTATAVRELVAKKASGRESSVGPRSAGVDDLIRDELQHLAEDKPEKTRLSSDETLLALADATYLEIVGLHGVR